MSRLLVVSVLGMVSAASVLGQPESGRGGDARALLAEVDRVMYSLPAAGAKQFTVHLKAGELINDQLGPEAELRLEWRWTAHGESERTFTGVPEETGRFGEQTEAVILHMLERAGLRSFEDLMRTCDAKIAVEDDLTSIELVHRDDSGSIRAETIRLDTAKKPRSWTAEVEDSAEERDLARGEKPEGETTKYVYPLQLQELESGRYLVSQYGPISLSYRKVEVPAAEGEPQKAYWVPTAAMTDGKVLFETKVTVDGAGDGS